MDYPYLLLVALSHVAARGLPRSVFINSKGDCIEKNFVPQIQTYYFQAHKKLVCEVPISVPTHYGQHQYCITVENAILHGNCPIELRIYEGLTSFGKTPKVTITCDSTSITSPLCVSGVGNGLFIMYHVFSPSSDSEISLRITYGDIPRTTTVFTPNNYDEDESYGSDENISTLVPLLAIVAVMILVCLCVYYCCCKKSSRGAVIREPDNRQPAFSDPISQGQSPPRPSAPAYNEPPPSYANTIPLVEPTAPPVISDDPPPYDSVIKNAV